MPIDVRCSCDARFSVRDEYAGKKGQCPTCGAVVQIPLAGGNPEVVTDDELEDFDVDTDEPAPTRRRRRRGFVSTYWRGLDHGVLGLTRQAGMLLLMLGLISVLLSRGCDSTGNRSIASLGAEYELAQNAFEDRWEAKKVDLQQKINEQQSEIEAITKEQSRLTEERFSENKDETFRYAEELEKLQKQKDDFDERIADLRKDIREIDEDEAKERRELMLDEWRDYRTAMRDARAENTRNSWWRAWLFTIGTIVLAVGLLTLASTGEGYERIASLVMIAILTFSIYVGGLAWMDTAVNNVTDTVRQQSGMGL